MTLFSKCQQEENYMKSYAMAVIAYTFLVLGIIGSIISFITLYDTMTITTLLILTIIIIVSVLLVFSILLALTKTLERLEDIEIDLYEMKRKSNLD